MKMVPIDEVTIIRITGEDSVAVLNNLCTNDVKALSPGETCEAFITNLKGWVVGHVVVRRTDSGLDLYGIGSFADAAIAHIDRYVIREDVRFEDRSSEDRLFIFDADLPKAISDAVIDLKVPLGNWKLVTATAAGYSELESHSDVEILSPAAFDSIRIQAFWPRLNFEIGDKTLPQELMRDEKAISFTKGCYLGQETIARLDARGQLQKQLCLLTTPALDGLPSGDVENEAGKVVGQVTSAGSNDSQTHALALIKRGSNEPGTQLSIAGVTFSVQSTP